MVVVILSGQPFSANEAKIGAKEDFLPEKIFSYLKRYFPI
jgi:hypothetical protein